jgi:superfamily II DNA or RNA helicase
MGVSGRLGFGSDPWAQSDDGLRFYQRDIAFAVLKAFETHRSTLVVAATGMGKTQIFASLAGVWTGRVLVLAHRDELVDQARRRIEQMTGEWVQVEQGLMRAELTTRLVVASVDTMRQQKRLERFARDHFSLIIVDEAHHYAGNTYVRPLEYFESAKILGVTATPNRADERALGMTFDSVAYRLDISDGIELGYLVPIVGRQITLDEIDISGVGKTGKDLAAGQLDEVIVKAVEGIVRETIRLEPDRQGIAFFPGVKSAEYAAAKFNALRPGSARLITGQTDPDTRKQLVRDFRRGEFQYLTNCQVATEGFDAPSVSLIVMGRPTLSQSLYTQMTGRGTRVLPGTVEHIHQRDASEARRAAIASSGKPDCVVLDFVGNSGKHSLIGREDVLGGRYSPAEVKLAKQKRLATGGDPRAALEAARQELQRIAKAVEAKVKSEVRAFDPFRVFHIDREGIVDHGRKAPSKGQLDMLLSAGIEPTELKGVSFDEAQKLVRTVQKRRQLGLCTYRQLRVLRRYGLSDPNLSLRCARAALDYLSSVGWHNPDPAVLERIAAYSSQGGK